jgi:aminoglycoside phosphotransferase (APT) family kinase protein
MEADGGSGLEISSSRLPDSSLGPRLAAGRDMVVHALGDDRVVRQAADARSLVVEAQLMEHVRSAGYPVPRVFRVGPGQMVLERVEGPTMLEDLGKRPWKLRAHARMLADLHRRLHRIEAPESLRAFPVAGRSVLHLDLHPGNVMLSPDGPVVIDWTNVARGDGAADVALTWMILAAFEADEKGIMRVIVPLFRSTLVRTFVNAAGRDDARRALAAVADYRSGDRNIRPRELARVEALVAREALGG